jgi:glycolate oxidase FAD binding subunit
MTAAAVATTELVRDRIREARSAGTALRVTGSGTWLDAGRGVRATQTLATRELAGIVAYVPGDLTLTARAGTTLGEIRDATAQHNQWLALDPHGVDDGTLGATVATASAGPLSAAFGTPRDLVLGLEFVTGMASIARAGGRVVKNVAGYDLARLFTGSWGTLGVITEVTVRLHARPPVDVSLAIRLGGGAADVERVWQMLRRLPFTPYSCEIINSALAASLTGFEDAGESVIFRLGGNTEAVAAQRAAIEALGKAREIDPDMWRELRAVEPAGSMVFRLSRVASEMARTWSEAEALVRDCQGTLIHARPARGLVRVIVPRNDATIANLRVSLASTAAAKRVGERLPNNLWPLVAPAPTADSLSTRIKQAFDPGRVLNPGILGEPA